MRTALVLVLALLGGCDRPPMPQTNEGVRGGTNRAPMTESPAIGSERNPAREEP